MALGAGFWTYDGIEERLVNALLLWRRMPDRERGWLHVRAHWPEIRRLVGRLGRAVGGEVDHEEENPQPRPRPLTRAQVGEMEAASELLRFVPERDRKLVALAVAWLASGETRVPWTRVLGDLGLDLTTDALRKRYSAAITAICEGVNGGNPRGGPVKMK